MGFKEVSNKVDFIALEDDILKFWRETDAFNELRRLRATTEREFGTFSFVDGPATANNPLGVLYTSRNPFARMNTKRDRQA